MNLKKYMKKERKICKAPVAWTEAFFEICFILVAVIVAATSASASRASASATEEQ